MAEPVTPRVGREGARWINERPTPEDFGKWFEANVKIDPALEAGDYVGGVVLIPAVDTKAKRVIGFNQANGSPIIVESEELAFIPYPKVETRINYFWDLMTAHEEWVGVVESVTPARLPIDPIREVIEAISEAEGHPVTERTTKYGSPAMAAFVHQLPDGFHVMSIPVDNGYTHFLCCTKRVAIYRADENGNPKGVPLRMGEGTKMTPLVLGRNQHYADPNSIMKAETGALGRALGFAGIFNIPGSGVATAEDMLEAGAQPDTAVSTATAPAQGDGAGPAAPTQAPARTGAEQAAEDEAALKATAKDLWKKLSDEHPEAAGEFGQWCQARRPPLRNLGEVRGAALRGVVKKLESLLVAAEERSQQAPTGPIEGGVDGGDGPVAAEPAAEPVA